MAPIDRLLAFASRWFDRATVVNVFEPLLADWQREWIEASGFNRRWIFLRGITAFAIALLVCAPRVILFTPTPPAIARRVIARIIIVTSVISALLMVPYAVDLAQVAPWRAVIIGLSVLPSCVLLALPFAMVAVADAIRRDKLPNHIARAAALRIAITASILMVAMGGWIVPASNQLARITMNRGANHQPPRRGVRELSTFELLRPQRASAVDEVIPAFARRRELNNRISLTLLPALFLWRRWRALDLPLGRWFSPLPVVFATFTVLCGYLFLRVSDRLVENVWLLPRGAGAWVPIVAFALIGIIRQRIARDHAPAPAMHQAP